MPAGSTPEICVTVFGATANGNCFIRGAAKEITNEMFTAADTDFSSRLHSSFCLSHLYSFKNIFSVVNACGRWYITCDMIDLTMEE
jgi:hypothetical protein